MAIVRRCLRPTLCSPNRKKGECMPVASSLQELIDALKTRKTNIARALDDLFGNANALNQLAGNPNKDALLTDWILGRKGGDPLPDWAVNELKAGPGSTGLVAHPLTDDEILHIRNWPANHKNDLAKKLHQAIEGNAPLEFFWELYGKDKEDMDTSVAGQVIFRSPQQNVSVSGWFTALANLLASIKVKGNQ